MKRVLAAVLLAGSLSGCGAGLARGDVAAEIGRETITIDELRALVEEGLANRQFAARVGEDRAEYQREVLGREITSMLSAEAARRLGISVTAEQVARRRKEIDDSYRTQGAGLVERAAAGGLPAERIDAWVRDLLLTELVVDELVEGERLTPQQLRSLDTATVQHILLSDQRTADDVYAQARAGVDFAALARRHSKDTDTKDDAGRLPPVRRGQYDAELDRPIFSVPLGVVQPPIRTRFGYHVLRVLDRTTVEESDVTPEARRALLAEVRTARFREYMTRLAEELGLEVNPRFGGWDAEQLVVAPSPDDLSSPPATVRPAPPGGQGGTPLPGGTGRPTPSPTG